MKRILSIISIVTLCILCVACTNNQPAENLWETALYTQDTSFGNGKNTVDVTVEAGDKSVVFTIKSDKTTVGEALKEHNLIDGEMGAYGLYVKSVNGIIADYNIDQSYWSFNKSGEYMTTGVDVTQFSDGDKFELVYTK
jgi:hypothetical protein